MATWFNLVGIQEFRQFIDPASSIATVGLYGEDFAPEVFHVELCDLPECQEAIHKAPVTSTFLSRSSVVKYNWKLINIRDSSGLA